LFRQTARFDLRPPIARRRPSKRGSPALFGQTARVGFVSPEGLTLL
jgi:hypothetical protein